MANGALEERGRSRIPATLQAVFLASNRGKEVYKPPPDQVASKAFQRQLPSAPQSPTRPHGWERIRKIGRRLSLGFTPDAKRRKSNKRKEGSRDGAASPSPSPTPAVPVSPVPEKTKEKKKPKQKRYPSMSPQAYLDAMLRNQGYSNEKVATLQTAYRNTPTELQKASYNVYLISIARSGDSDGLKALFQAGLSANPCNDHGESLLHSICRQVSPGVLETMIECGTCLEVTDDYGRTPLHDACWAANPAFNIVEILMKSVKSSHYLFHMTDARGCTPLDYIRREHWAEWIEYLQQKKNDFWPRDGDKNRPEVLQLPPNSRPVPDPKDALPIDLAKMVAAGRMKPDEARILMEEESDDEEEDEEDDDDDSSYSDDDDSDDDSMGSASYDDSDDSSSLEEMADMLEILAMPRKQVAPVQPMSIDDDNTSFDEKAMAQLLTHLSHPNSGGNVQIQW